MIEFLERSHDHVIAIKVGNTLTVADYERVLIPRIDDLLSRYKAINILFVMDDTFSGWSLDAAWEDASFALKRRAQLERIAVVGAPDWVRWCMAASAFLMPGEMRSFPADQLDMAWKWVDVPPKAAAAVS